MRYELVTEGVLYSNGYYFEPGSITWNESEPLPIATQGNLLSAGSFCGWATDIERSEDGVISCEIEHVELPEGHAFSFFAKDVDFEQEGHSTHVKVARIVHATILSPPQIPTIKE